MCLTEEAQNEFKHTLAWFYVNECASSQTQAYMKAREAIGTPVPHSVANSNAYKAFRDPLVKEYIRQFREENKEKYAYLREDNIAMLREIAASSKSNKDRVSAIKELNSMCGFNQQNINANVDSNIDVIIEGS